MRAGRLPAARKHTGADPALVCFAELLIQPCRREPEVSGELVVAGAGEADRVRWDEKIRVVSGTVGVHRASLPVRERREEALVAGYRARYQIAEHVPAVRRGEQIAG